MSRADPGATLLEVVEDLVGRRLARHPQQGHQDQQRREQRQDAVVRQRRGAVAELVVLELPHGALQHGPPGPLRQLCRLVRLLPFHLLVRPRRLLPAGRRSRGEAVVGIRARCHVTGVTATGRTMRPCGPCPRAQAGTKGIFPASSPSAARSGPSERVVRSRRAGRPRRRTRRGSAHRRSAPARRGRPRASRRAVPPRRSGARSGRGGAVPEVLVTEFADRCAQRRPGAREEIRFGKAVAAPRAGQAPRPGVPVGPAGRYGRYGRYGCSGCPPRAAGHRGRRSAAWPA